MTTYDTKVFELNNTSPTVEQPSNFKIELKPHQLTLLSSCLHFEKCKIFLSTYPHIKDKYNEYDNIQTKMGILGDMAGSGKSYVILALILANPKIEICDYNTYGINGNKNIYVDVSSTIAHKYVKTNLIVIPHNLCFQWESYIRESVDQGVWKYKIVSRGNELNEFMCDIKQLSSYDIIVITDGCYNSIQNILASNDIYVNRVIYDDVDSLRIPKNKSITCKFTWYITASYSNLLYPNGYYERERITGYANIITRAVGLANKGDIRDLFTHISNSMDKDLARLLVIKNEDAYVKSSYDIPEPHEYIIECLEPLYTKLLNGIVQRDIIHLLNANDFQGAVDVFSPHQKNTESNIIELIISGYSSNIADIEEEIDNLETRVFCPNNADCDAEKRNDRLTVLEEDKQRIEKKVQSIRERISENNACNICYDETDNTTKTILKCCSNVFCFYCINMWLSEKGVCPMCKSELNERDMYLVQPGENGDFDCNEDDAESMNDNPTKMDKSYDKLKNLRIILRQLDEGERLLIFSEHDMSFEGISDILHEMEISYSCLKGNKYQINRIINDYRNGYIQVLMVNYNNFGCGLNLECTDTVILFHHFTKEMSNQIIGRAQRIGRTQPLNIYYLLNENEMAMNLNE